MDLEVGKKYRFQTGTQEYKVVYKKGSQAVLEDPEGNLAIYYQHGSYKLVEVQERPEEGQLWRHRQGKALAEIHEVTPKNNVVIRWQGSINLFTRPMHDFLQDYVRVEDER